MNSRSWTSLDLEVFQDGESEEAPRASIGQALRQDPALRERLAAASRVDAVARRALVDRSDASPCPLAPRRPGAVLLALAAVLALALTAALWLRPAPKAPSPPVLAEAATVPSSFRVLWTIPVTAPAPAAPPGTSLVEAAPSAGSVEQALWAGDAEGAARMLAEAAPEARAAAYRRLGELIRSAAACEQVLDAMEPAEQLEVCRQWALDPRLRPVTFSRLASLAANNSLSQRHAAVVSDLSEYAELRPWLRSYIGTSRPTASPGRRG